MEIPSDSILPRLPYDYIDSFEYTIEDPTNQVDSLSVCRAFFSTTPSWVAWLFELRNQIVQFIGLKTGEKVEDRATKLAQFEGNPGDRLGLFEVFQHAPPGEMIIGENDAHLDFRVSLLVTPVAGFKKQITITTTVKYNNLLGRIYFFFVRPFHRLIIPQMLKGIIQSVEKQ